MVAKTNTDIEANPTQAGCNPEQCGLQALERRGIVGAFDGGQMIQRWRHAAEGAEGVGQVIGLDRNSRQRQRIGKAEHKSRRCCIATGRPSRRFRQFRYRTRKSWSRSRRVVAYAEWLPGMGGNPRFVVPNLAGDSIGTREFRESLHCARGPGKQDKGAAAPAFR